MAPPARLLLLAALLGTLTFPLAAEERPSCPDSYKSPEYLETWELKRSDWLKGCEEGKSPQALLEEGQKRFIDGCQRIARQLVKDGRISLEKLAGHCSQGRPGKAKIPGLSQEYSQSAPTKPSPLLEKGGKTIAAWEEGVRARLNAGQVPALYSENAPVDGPSSVSAGNVQPVPKPAEPDIADQPERNPSSKGFERSSSPPPLEPTPYDEDIEKILNRVVRHEANAESQQQAQRVIRVMSTEMPASVRKNLVRNKIQVEIIPKDKKVTDLPNFSGLKGKKTFDGRLWDDVRGAANQRLADGGAACAIPEENLLPGGVGYIRFYVLAHEYGHMVLTNGLPLKAPPPGKTRRAASFPSLERLRSLVFSSFSSTMEPSAAAARDTPPPGQDEVEKTYIESMKRAEKTGLGDYADSSKGEMFAESSACYFGVNSPVKSAAELKTANENLHSIMARTYGSPRKVSL